MSQALSRLPKGQMQRLQAIMQKAMHGKDVSKEAAELEKSLPPDFQDMIRSMQAQLPAGAPGTETAQAVATQPEPSQKTSPKMSEEEARRIVEAAVAQGKVSREQADALLAANPTQQDRTEESKLGKLWRGLKGKSK
jgi:hypothetical protein